MSLLWKIARVERLNLRMTYGVGGNVPKNAGPYMTVVDSGYNDWVGDFGSYIKNPPILTSLGENGFYQCGA